MYFVHSQKLIPQKCIPEDLQIAKINSAKINAAKNNYFRVIKCFQTRTCKSPYNFDEKK